MIFVIEASQVRLTDMDGPADGISLDKMLGFQTLAALSNLGSEACRGPAKGSDFLASWSFGF